MAKHIPVTPIKYTDYGITGKKQDRIRMMQPYFSAHRIMLPKPEEDPMTAVFVNKEYKPFPVASSTDMLDALHICLLMTPHVKQKKLNISW